LSAHACSSIRAFDWGAWPSPVEAAMNDTVPHDTSGGAASASTVRSLSGSTVGPSGSHDIIGPLQKASGPRKTEKTAMSHFPGLQDRVLSKCSDAHIYLDQETCSPFQKWQFAFVSSGIWRRVSVGRVAMTLQANGVTWLRRTVLPQGSPGPDAACPRAPSTAPSCARWPRAATFGAWRAHDDPRVIVPARRFLLRRRVGGCWRHQAVRLQAPRRAAINRTRPPVRRVGLPARRAQVRCAAEWRPRPWARRDAGGPPPLRCSRGLSVCVHHYTLRAPCPKGRGIASPTYQEPTRCR